MTVMTPEEPQMPVAPPCWLANNGACVKGNCACTIGEFEVFPDKPPIPEHVTRRSCPPEGHLGMNLTMLGVCDQCGATE